MSTLQFTPNPGSVGVRIHGLDLAVPMTAVATRQVQQLLHQYRLVIFEGQVLDDAALCGFVHRFGPPFAPPSENPVLGGAGQASSVVVVGNRADEFDQAFLGHQEVLPHSDHQWLRCPSAASLLYAIDIAPGSSPTMWIDMAAAYASLDDAMKQRIQHLKLITYNPFHRPFGSVQARYVDSRNEQVPGSVYPHPLVRTHPASGERILYLHAAYEMELEGLGYAEGKALIDVLLAHIAAVPPRYEHAWKNGDLVMWDNQATVHYRPAFHADVRRVLKRVTIGGGIPY
jgi:taurine dioxygenase